MIRKLASGETCGNVYVMEFKGNCVCIDIQTMDVIFKGRYKDCKKYLKRKRIIPSVVNLYYF